MAGAIGWFGIALIVWVVWKIAAALISNKSEGARRLKVVLGIALATLFTVIVFNMGGPVAVVITGAVLGSVWWVIKGINK